MLGLRRFQDMDENDPLSYYAISGAYANTTFLSFQITYHVHCIADTSMKAYTGAPIKYGKTPKAPRGHQSQDTARTVTDCFLPGTVRIWPCSRYFCSFFPL